MNIIAIISVVLAYLIGSVSFSYLMAKWVKGVDIREHGSGNAGATNTLRLLGKGPAILVLVLDALKGVLAIYLGYLLVGNNPSILALCGMLAIFGHNWPVFLRFRGGKGVATTIGVVMSLVFYAGLISGIIAIILIVFTRFVSLGSLVFTVGLPFTVLALSGHYPIPYLWLSIAIAILAIVRQYTKYQKFISRYRAQTRSDGRRETMKKIAVLGAGSWGTVLANVVADNGHEVEIWARKAEVAKEINSLHQNSAYLGDSSLHADLRASTSLEEVVTGKEVILFAIPSHAMRDMLIQVETFCTRRCSTYSCNQRF